MRLRATRLIAYSGAAKRRWTPAQITTALWLDAADTSTITLNGSTVSQWDDKSGNARNATQATAANQPTYNATGILGKPSLSFDGADDSLGISAWSSSPPYAVFVVLKKNNAAQASWNGVFTMLQSGNNVFWMGQNSGTATNARMGNANLAEDLDITGFFQLDVPNVHAAVQSGTYELTAWRTGNQLGSRALTNIGQASRSLTLGRSTITTINGFISEVVMVSETALSVSDRQKIEGYLAWKWGGA